MQLFLVILIVFLLLVISVFAVFFKYIAEVKQISTIANVRILSRFKRINIYMVLGIVISVLYCITLVRNFMYDSDEYFFNNVIRLIFLIFLISYLFLTYKTSNIYIVNNEYLILPTYNPKFTKKSIKKYSFSRRNLVIIDENSKKYIIYVTNLDTINELENFFKDS